VGVVVVVPGQAEPWKVSNAAYRLFETEVRAVAPSPADALFMTVAVANHGLFLNAFQPLERGRIAGLIGLAARGLRRRLLDAQEPSERDRELAAYLSVLEMWVDGLAPAADN
jgi:hypothetical protein